MKSGSPTHWPWKCLSTLWSHEGKSSTITLLIKYVKLQNIGWWKLQTETIQLTSPKSRAVTSSGKINGSPANWFGLGLDSTQNYIRKWQIRTPLYYQTTTIIIIIIIKFITFDMNFMFNASTKHRRKGHQSRTHIRSAGLHGTAKSSHRSLIL